jgi:hypothetical protein
MSTCAVPVLNGACSNSEGGRLARMMKTQCYKGNVTSFQSETSCCLKPIRLSTPTDTIVITPPESTRINTICGTSSRKMTQEYVKSLLSTTNTNICQNISPAQTITMTNVPFFTSRIEPTDLKFVPTPPPPGPPARPCVLTKNQKMS